MNQRLKLENYYYTEDICLVSTLTLFGASINCLDKTDSKRIIFIINRIPELDTLISSYYQGQLKVEVRTFYHQLKIVKGKLYGK